MRRHPSLVAFGAYLALAAAATWPLLAHFGTALAGDGAGAWRTLWAFWWWGESVGRHASPFFSDALRWPSGTPLPLHVTNVPSALAVVPLWRLTPGLPEVALYNVFVLASYPLAGFAVYLLARELWGGELAPFLAGAIYTVGVLHCGASALLEGVTVWSPVYFLGLVRTVRRHGAGSPLLAGTALALAALTSPAHLVLCSVGTVVLLVAWWRNDRAVLASAAFARRMGLLLLSFGALAGWSYFGALRARAGLAAPPAVPGADLLSFFVPGAGSAWSPAAGGGGAPATYAGYLVLALGVVASIRARASRPWIAMAAVGFLLALGPRLRIAGAELPGFVLPLGWIDAAARVQRAVMDPARFGWLVTFGLAVGAGAALAQVARAHRRGAVLAASLTALALLEGWPGALPTSTWPAPRFLRDLARDGERWAVLDATGPERQLWNQVLHKHPQLGGAIAGAPPTEVPGTGSAVLDALLDASTARRARAPAVAAERQDAVRALQARNVRFVIVDDEKLGVARALRLPRAYAGDGLVVFEVPPGTG